MNIQNLVQELKTKLSAHGKADIDRIAKLPEVQAIIQREEEVALAERRNLIAELAEVPSQFEKLHAAAGKQVEIETARLLAARRELNAACESQTAAICRAAGMGARESATVFAIRQKLEVGADPRLPHFRSAVEQVMNNSLRHCVVAWPTTTTDWLTKEKTTSFASNEQEIRALMAVMQGALNAADDALFQAISRSEVTALMQSWIDKFSPGLAELGLDVLSLDADGNVRRQRNMPTVELTEAAISKAKGAGKMALA